MSAILDMSKQSLWYKVDHVDFNANLVYKAIAYIDYGESAWSQLLFVNERGMTFAVSVKHTVCLSAGREELYREPDAWEKKVEMPKSRMKENDE